MGTFSYMKKDAVKRKETICSLPVTDTTRGKRWYLKDKHFGQTLGRSFLTESYALEDPAWAGVKPLSIDW